MKLKGKKIKNRGWGLTSCLLKEYKWMVITLNV